MFPFLGTRRTVRAREGEWLPKSHSRQVAEVDSAPSPPDCCPVLPHHSGRLLREPQLGGPALDPDTACYPPFYCALLALRAPSPAAVFDHCVLSHLCPYVTPHTVRGAHVLQEDHSAFNTAGGHCVHLYFIFYFIRASMQQIELENLEAQREGCFRVDIFIGTEELMLGKKPCDDNFVHCCSLA